jgi:DNA-binding transcriptional ArsR family regulator
LTAEAAPGTINRLVNNHKQVTAIFAALADPTRRRILVRLSNKAESPVTALSKPFRISPPAVSRHLRVLETARLIERRREGRTHLIRARPDGLKEAQEWLNRCAAAWDFSFDALNRLLTNPERKEKKP